MKLVRWISLAVLFISSAAFSNEDTQSIEKQLCQYVKQDSERQFFSVILANDIRLYSNYRNIYCESEVGFEGGSLLKTAHHYGANQLFDRLVKTIEVDDIFWEKAVHNAGAVRAVASRN